MGHQGRRDRQVRAFDTVPRLETRRATSTHPLPASGGQLTRNDQPPSRLHPGGRRPRPRRRHPDPARRPRHARRRARGRRGQRRHHRHRHHRRRRPQRRGRPHQRCPSPGPQLVPLAALPHADREQGPDPAGGNRRRRDRRRPPPRAARRPAAGHHPDNRPARHGRWHHPPGRAQPRRGHRLLRHTSAQDQLRAKPGRFTAVTVDATPGSTDSALRQRLQTALGTGYTIREWTAPAYGCYATASPPTAPSSGTATASPHAPPRDAVTAPSPHVAAQRIKRAGPAGSRQAVRPLGNGAGRLRR